MTENTVDYEHLPAGMAMDESDISLRALLAKKSDAKLKEYNPSWTDEQLLEWEPDFRNDGNLMLICTERDVDIEEYRRVLEEHITFRKQFGAKI